VNFERYSLFGIGFSIFIIFIDLYLLKKRKIRGGTFTRWLIIGSGTGIVSAVPAVFTLFYEILGTEVLISSVTVMSFMILLLLIFYIDYKLNSLNDKLTKLVIKMSSDKYDLKQNREGSSQHKDQ